LKVSIQPPDFGSERSQEGNKANNTKGIARARENPNMPVAGPESFPEAAAWTSNVPIIGPVQLKLY